MADFYWRVFLAPTTGNPDVCKYLHAAQPRYTLHVKQITFSPTDLQVKLVGLPQFLDVGQPELEFGYTNSSPTSQAIGNKIAFGVKRYRTSQVHVNIQERV